MPRVGDIAQKVRSKNAGPFWLTIDIFCGDVAAFDAVRQGLQTRAVADAFGIGAQVIKRFDIEDLHVVKLSLPRPVVQGHRHDRDMHGAAWAVLVADLDLTPAASD